ncbi:tRNA threonylcarbamoyladenosine dehydratase [Caldimonas sp.]|uniref:tRNA threonylcarbamoyladenosine dehydratase n=1 Tax=Caldimonas sp. TaxID=2838790 RepID=UPI00307D9CB7
MEPAASWAEGLVPPSDDLELERRFGGLRRLYGAAGYGRIRAARVAVVGVGGVGSWAVEALARSGVAELVLIDLDHVAESNINRQIHALDATLGQAKVLALRERIAGIHPGCRVRAIEEFVEPDNWPALLDGHTIDALIDGCDQVRAKQALAQWALSQPRLVHVCVGAAGGKRHAHRVELADLAEVTHDPLLASLRQRLRKQGLAPRQGRIGVACVYSKEPVGRPDGACSTDGSLNCHGYGSVVSVTATFGLVAAGTVLDRLAAGKA